MFKYCKSPAARSTFPFQTGHVAKRRDDSIVVLSCFILCLCLGCPLMRITGQPLFYILLLQQNMPGKCLLRSSAVTSLSKIPKNAEPLPDIDA